MVFMEFISYTTYKLWGDYILEIVNTKNPDIQQNQYTFGGYNNGQ